MYEDFDEESIKANAYKSSTKIKLQNNKGDMDMSRESKKDVILITDDMYSNRLVIREMLKKLSIMTMEAINGEKAVDIVKQSFEHESDFKIALILMDLNMPIMNGLMSTQKIRELERLRKTKIPIIAVTAHDGQSDRKGCYNAGMQDYILKPISSKILESLIKGYAPFLLDNK